MYKVTPVTPNIYIVGYIVFFSKRIFFKKYRSPYLELGVTFYPQAKSIDSVYDF